MMHKDRRKQTDSWEFFLSLHTLNQTYFDSCGFFVNKTVCTMFLSYELKWRIYLNQKQHELMPFSNIFSLNLLNWWCWCFSAWSKLVLNKDFISNFQNQKLWVEAIRYKLWIFIKNAFSRGVSKERERSSQN